MNLDCCSLSLKICNFIPVNLGIEYIKYLWIAKQRHGIHSPFVYELTDNCFKQNFDIQTENTLNSLSERLLKDVRTIVVEDFGAGSKKLSNQRKVSSIFKTSSSEGKYGKMLYQLTKHFKPENMLEFGTSLGIGSILMHQGYPNGNLTTIEACPNVWKIANENFNSLDINVKNINSTFNDFLKQDNHTNYDLIFVDGHHDGEALLKYMEDLKKLSSNDTIFIIDDIRWSDSMFEAWNELKSNPDYHVSIDFFRMGLLSPRPQQEKEHFTIRL